MYLQKSKMVDSISEQLMNLSKFVLIKNQMGFTDINKGAENLFCHLLNIIYELQLKNMNDLQSNYPAIDLGDKQARVCFQVTAENKKTKIDDTIKKFKNKQFERDYDRLVFLIISDKKKPKIDVNENFEVSILDIKDIILDISRVGDISRIDKINQHLTQNLKSSVPISRSILPTTIIQVRSDLKYERFIRFLDLNPGQENDKEYINQLINALNDLQTILAQLSNEEREYIYFLISHGSQPEGGSHHSRDRLLTPFEKLNLHLTYPKAVKIFESLSSSGLVYAIADYQPYPDAPYIQAIEVVFYGELETNLFADIKDFSKDDIPLLYNIIINSDFSLLC